MSGTIHPDVARARLAAGRLLETYQTVGIFGKQEMPEDSPPEGVTPGSEEHLRFITLSVAIDYQRDADELWDAARRTYADPDLRYLFDPVAVDRHPRSQIVPDLHRYGLSRKAEQDATIWQTIAGTLTAHFGGRVTGLLEAAGYDALRLLALIRSPEHRGRFPFLQGPKIGPLWIRMLHDNCGVQFRNLDRVPLPVDIHTAQASVELGVVQTDGFAGQMKPLRDAAQTAWQQALADSDSYPLRLDEPLWLLSKYGCRKTQTWPCEFRNACPVADLCDPRGPRVSVQGAQITDRSECRISFRTER